MYPSWAVFTGMRYHYRAGTSNIHTSKDRRLQSSAASICQQAYETSSVHALSHTEIGLPAPEPNSKLAHLKPKNAAHAHAAICLCQEDRG